MICVRRSLDASLLAVKDRKHILPVPGPARNSRKYTSSRVLHSLFSHIPALATPTGYEILGAREMMATSPCADWRSPFATGGRHTALCCFLSISTFIPRCFDGVHRTSVSNKWSALACSRSNKCCFKGVQLTERNVPFSESLCVAVPRVYRCVTLSTADSPFFLVSRPVETAACHPLVT